MGAINWISGISAVAIGVVTAALVCVLAVFNGYVVMIMDGSERIDPDLVVQPRAGSVLTLGEGSALVEALRSECVASYAPVLHSRGILRTDGQELMAEVYGVDRAYGRVVALDSVLIEGRGLLAFDSIEGAEKSGVPMLIGMALAAEGATQYSAEERYPALYFPRRVGLINPLAAHTAFRSVWLRPEGVFSVEREDFDRSIYMPIETLRQELDYADTVASYVAIKVAPNWSVAGAQRALSSQLDGEFRVLNREEQQPELTFLVKAERLMVYAVMLFVLILAAFNLSSSLVMLMMEKDQDLATLRAMGSTRRQQASIFAMTGLLISGLGVVLGGGLGLLLCQLQQSFGFITAGEGASRMPFPIDIQSEDLLLIAVGAVVISFLSSVLPSVFFRKK